MFCKNAECCLKAFPCYRVDLSNLIQVSTLTHMPPPTESQFDSVDLARLSLWSVALAARMEAHAERSSDSHDNASFLC